jgi:hypothetical protein
VARYHTADVAVAGVVAVAVVVAIAKAVVALVVCG